MKYYFFIYCFIILVSSCKKDDEQYDKQSIKISNQSDVAWDSICVYSVVRNSICDTLTIKNMSQRKDTNIVWKNITTAEEDAWFDFEVFLSNKKVLKGNGGQRDDLPYSKITLSMDLIIYSDSIKILSY